jgi:hypothetical protein
VKPEEWDAFHELIIIDELARCGAGGILWGIQGGLAIGLPPILNFGSQVWISLSLSLHSLQTKRGENGFYFCFILI